jgi:hypothetical protein
VLVWKIRRLLSTDDAGHISSVVHISRVPWQGDLLIPLSKMLARSRQRNVYGAAAPW